MYFSHFIKDYIDSANSFYDSLYGNVNLFSILQFNFFYLANSIKILIQYLLTFRWVSDFSSLKISIPSLISSNFLETSTLENPTLNFFKFFEPANFAQNKFFIGFFNSFLYSIPMSSGQILWLRRLVVEGIPSGIAGGIGIIIGQVVFIICVLGGFRFFLFPWFSVESLHYIFGLILTLSIVYQIGRRPIKRIKNTEKQKLLRIALGHFVLIWTEQSIIFPYISNLSVSSQPTVFENLPVNNLIESIYNYGDYLSGILIGTIFWMVFFGWVTLMLGFIISKLLNLSYSRWIQGFHFSSLVIIIAFCLTTLPYYSLDYLTTSSLGFISQDQVFNNFQLKTNLRDLRRGRLGEYSSHSSLDTDVSAFDRGRYSTSSEVELTFEDLNYQGEYVWRSRNDRLASGSVGIVNKLMAKFLPKSKYRQASNLKKIDKNVNSEKSKLISSFLINNESLIKRFLDDYSNDAEHISMADFYTGLDQESYSAFSELVKYGFDAFASLEDIESDEFEEKLGKKIKSKYYSNLVYQSILNVEMFDFINRQPKTYNLTESEEREIFKKRLILSNYYDSLRDYSKTPYYENFQDLFMGSKSYANRVYNQQFKGTLKILRRLFSISLEDDLYFKNKVILKYDQPLYKDKIKNKNSFTHEELNQLMPSKIEGKKKFLKEASPIPFYAGWDDNLRKFLITNYYLSSSKTSSYIDPTNTFSRKYSRSLKRTADQQNENFRFVAWPVSELKTEKLKKKPNEQLQFMFSSFDDPATEQQRDIFEYAESDDYDVRLIYETLPSIIKRVDLRDKEKDQIYVQPVRGGFLWHGSNPLKFKIKKLINDLRSTKRDWRDSNP